MHDRKFINDFFDIDWKIMKEFMVTSLLHFLKWTQNFPNIYCPLTTLAVLPVTSCEAEHCISMLRRVITYSRGTMGQECFTGLALLHMSIQTSSFHYMRPLTLFQLLAYAAVEVFPTFPFILVPIYRTNFASDVCLDGRSSMNI